MTNLRSVYPGKQYAADILSNDGGKYSVQRGTNGLSITPVSLSAGYMVALDGYEYVVSADALTDILIGEFIGRNLNVLTTPGYYLGFWVTNGRVYLDVSRLIDGFDSAVLSGVINNQQAIWDNARSTAIDLSNPSVIFADA